MPEITTYHATAEREGRYWVVKFHDLPPGYFGTTQGRSWKEAQAMAEDLITTMLEATPDTFRVEMRPADPAMAHAVDEALRLQEEAEAAAARAKTALTAAARTLTGQGLTVREAGALLGISAAYVSQLAPQSP